MGYFKANGQYANTEAVVLSPAAALTEDGNSASLELGDRAVARLTLAATAVSAGDTLDVTVQTSRDGTTWYTSGTFTQVTTTGSETKCFLLDRFVRAAYNVTGSDVSITCTLTGEAV
jgi:hypothetical protein